MVGLCRPPVAPNIAAVPRHRQSTSSTQIWPRLRLAYWAAAGLLSVAALIGTRATVSAATPPTSELVQAELLAEPASIAPGQPFWVALRLRIKDGWHTYWRNPGDSGEATSIAWQLPPGFEAGPIVWPTPSRLPVAHLMNYGYERETTLLTRISPPQSLDAAKPVEIAADVSWLVCEKICIPGETRLNVTLPVRRAPAAGEPASAARSIFDAARSALPQAAPGPRAPRACT